MWLSFASVPLPALGGTIHANPFNNQFLRVTDASGVDLYLQWLCQDLTVPAQITLSNAVTATTP